VRLTEHPGTDIERIGAARQRRIDRIKTIQLLSETFPLRREERFIAAGEPDARAL
jgi:hypothetical protein